MLIYNLIFNAILYVAYAIYLWRKEILSLRSSLIIFYAIISCLGVYIVNNGIYGKVYSLDNSSSQYILSYILCFISIFLLSNILKNVKYEKIKFSEIPYNKYINFIISIWFIDMILFCILKLSQAIISFSIGFNEAYNLSADEGGFQDYYYGNNTFILKFNNFNINLLASFLPFLICYSLYGLNNRYISKIKAWSIILLAIIAKTLNAISLGSRGNLFFTVVSFAFYFILFYPKLRENVKKSIKIFGIISLSIIVFYSISISIARLSNSSDPETTTESIFRYFGEPFPNLNNLFWNKVEHHPNGERLYPDIYYFLTGKKNNNDNLSIQEHYTYWKNITGVPVMNFKTILGDLYIEFGKGVALVIIGGLYLIFSLFIGKSTIHFWKIALIYWYYELVLQGIFGMVKSGHSELIVLMAIILVSVIMKFYTERKYR